METQIERQADVGTLFDEPAVAGRREFVWRMGRPVYVVRMADTADQSATGLSSLLLDRAEFLDLNEVQFLARRSYRSVRRDVLAGKLVEPIRRGRKLLWRRADVEAAYLTHAR